MTPAINLLQKNNVDFKIHQYEHDPNAESYGLEAAEKLSLDSQRVFKTLVIQLDNGNLVVAILPVAEKLSMKLCAKESRAKKAVMADQALVERTTGYIAGGISPLGQKKQLKTLLHNSALGFETIYVSAGRRGLEIELSAEDLLTLSHGKAVAICV